MTAHLLLLLLNLASEMLELFVELVLRLLETARRGAVQAGGTGV
jgi:hypothetical protein